MHLEGGGAGLRSNLRPSVEVRDKNLGIFYIFHDNFYLDSDGVSLPEYMAALIIHSSFQT